MVLRPFLRPKHFFSPKPILRVPHLLSCSRRSFRVSAIPYEYETELLGKGIVAFVFFYTSLQWFYYKRTREELEEFYRSDTKEIKPTKKKEENE